MEKPKRHLVAIEAIDRGLEEAGQITIQEGIRAAVDAGRMTVAEACEVSAYFEQPGLDNVIRIHPDPDGPEAA